MKRKTTILLICIVGVLFSLSVMLVIFNVHLRSSLKEIERTKEQEIANQVNLMAKEIKDTTREDLEEKYKADMVSYRAAIKRLELEEKKRKELEEKLSSTSEKGGK